jgi:hypothetical protein
MSSPQVKMSLSAMVLVVAPAAYYWLLGCDKKRKAFLFHGWDCQDLFWALQIPIVVGSALILWWNIRTKKHSIFWYIVGSGPLFLLGLFWFLWLVLHNASVPI